jgi:hypothetical protein
MRWIPGALLLAAACGIAGAAYGYERETHERLAQRGVESSTVGIGDALREMGIEEAAAVQQYPERWLHRFGQKTGWR